MRNVSQKYCKVSTQNVYANFVRLVTRACIGPTGVAHGALLAAVHCGLLSGGRMALGFANEIGPDRALVGCFHLNAFTHTGQLQPVRRTVKESDATLWVAAPPRVETVPA